jgi:hypothetical protein
VVYIYSRIDDEWILSGELPPPVGVQGGYGIEVSLGGYWMAAGARYSDSMRAMYARVALQAQPDAYADWAVLQGLLSPDRLPTADPDQDGISNLVEYASGLNPLLSQGGALSAATLSGLPIVLLNATGSPVCQYLSRSADGRLKETLEISTDLRNWTPLGATPRRRIAGTDSLELLEVALPANGASQYVRLRLERIAP